MTDKTKIAAELVGLRQAGAAVMSDLRRSHQSLQRHLSSIYLWWREARLIPGYLDAEYDELGRIFNTIKYGENYRPLLFLVYGEEAGLNKNNLPYYNGTLNALHIEYEKRPKLYERDGISKLTAFIANAGGVVQLAKTVPADDDDTKLPPIDRKKLLEIAVSIRELLLKEAVACSKGSPLPILPIKQYFSLGYERHSLLLVNKTDRGVGWFSTSVDTKLIQELLVDGVRRRFDLQHPKVRPLLELLHTQALPKHLAGLSQGLIEKGTVTGWGKKKFKAERRVLFLKDSGTFVLSPMNSESGVVSTVRPIIDGLPEKLKQPLFQDCQHDLLLQPTVVAGVEANMLHDFDFNLFDAGPLKSIPKYAESNSASHMLRFRHRADKQRTFNVPFWPCYDTFEEPQYQLLKNPDFKHKPLWKAKYSLFWFQQLSDIFLDRWLGSHAKHLKRPPAYKVRLVLDRESIDFEFVFRDGIFENFQNVPLESTAMCDGASIGQFASKDIVPVLRSVAHLPVDSEIDLELSSEVLRLRFTTISPGGSEHEILVPTLDAKDARSKAPFNLYQPTIVTDKTPQDTGAEA